MYEFGSDDYLASSAYYFFSFRYALQIFVEIQAYCIG